MVTHLRRPAFLDFDCARQLVHEMRLCAEDGLADSLAWVIMPDHLHWLLTLRQGSLAQLMKRLKARNTQAINRRSDISGSLWHPNYHDRAVRHDDDIQAMASYVVANPLRTGLVKRLGDYPLWDAMWL
ncbi:transposase [Pseudomonas sp. LS44]|uniref:REP-associated tyrosine transposase n=1 Tax=Pseudomonas sp. LS44 TaxID=1357074 RepID=UPI00215A515D|nr:transposase [Pseudomonas sp. LS44]UVE19618.1 transposase [Pseudomonas sp. LS44]